MQEPNGYGALLLPPEHVDDDDEDDDDDNGDVGEVSSWNGSTILLRLNDHRLLKRQADERHKSEPRSGAQPPVTDASSSCKLKSAAGLRQEAVS